MTTDERTLGLDQIMSLAWGKLMMQKRFVGASAVAALGYLLAQEAADKELRDTCLSILLKSIDELRSQEDKTSSTEVERCCSFCGRTEPAVKLAAGPNSFICNNCVELLADAFSEET